MPLSRVLSPLVPSVKNEGKMYKVVVYNIRGIVCSTAGPGNATPL